jgi:hypothetical protein
MVNPAQQRLHDGLVIEEGVPFVAIVFVVMMVKGRVKWRL